MKPVSLAQVSGRAEFSHRLSPARDF